MFIIRAVNTFGKSFTRRDYAFSWFQRNNTPRGKNIRSFKVNPTTSVSGMEPENLLSPPESVRGMKVLDRSAFNKTVMVPCLFVDSDRVQDIIQPLKSYLFKMVGIKNCQILEDGKHRVLFNPNTVRKFEDFNDTLREKFKELGIGVENFSKISIDITYENYVAPTVIKSILPKNEPPLTSFSAIGHVIQLNLKDALLEYKSIIGEILLDKVKTARTVVYKKNNIDNVYRNIDMELICGEPNYLVTVVEYGVRFEFDFSKVYWNPRLATEHDRIVRELERGDALFDVFAGVGPFSIRAALKRCHVFANDLNPDSFKWLNRNVELNKKSREYIRTFNKDGGEFILTDVRDNVARLWSDPDFRGRIHIVMNLPATALTFLKHFSGLVPGVDRVPASPRPPPLVHCHFFARDTENEREVFYRESGLPFDARPSFFRVRNVSTGKDMFRATFELPYGYLGKTEPDETEPPEAKRICTN